MSQKNEEEQFQENCRFKLCVANFSRWGRSLINQTDWKVAVKITVTAILSLYLSFALNRYVKHPDYLITDLWCVVASIIVLQTNIGGTYKAIWFRFIGVFIGSLVGALFAFNFGASVENIGIAIYLTIIVCSILKIPDSYRLAALSVVVIMLPWKFHPETNPWIFAFFRFLATCLGFLTAIFISHILWPSRALNDVRLDMATRFHLFCQFLALFLPSKNRDNTQVIQDLRNRVEQSFNRSQLSFEESKLELFMRSGPLSTWIEFFKYQERLWENLRTLQSVLKPSLEEIFDEKLKNQVEETLKFIHFSLEEIALKLENGQPITHFGQLEILQRSLSQESLRFRSVHRMRNYPLELVEDYFVFFYQIRHILMKIQNFNYLLVYLALK